MAARGVAAAGEGSMKAWVTHGFNDMRLEDVTAPVCRPGWAVVKTRVVQAAITEVQLFRGERSNGYDLIKKRLADEGPLQLFGHEFSAEIVELQDDGQSGLAVGDRVTAMHTRLGTIGRHFPGCFAELAAVPLDALAKMPDGVSDWEAAALQPLSSCVGIIRQLGITLGDTVVILGQGVMGLNCTQLAKAAGADTVIGVDRRQDLLDLASRLGADHTVNASVQDTVKTVMDLTGGKGAPFVIEAASGSPKVGLSGGSTVSDGVAVAAKGGRIFSIPHFDAPVTLDFNVLRAKGITYMFPQELAGRWEATLAARLVVQRRVQVEPMLTHKLGGIERVLEAMEMTANKAKYGVLNPVQVRIAT
ncbi:MAG: zinc-binding dehydrogenase [Deltaproteobacteria bacterium]|nr:zinc-binding dehydrogenase [Deltaproteobacteria bacterium]